jgi:tryptophan synthase alpha chain
MGYFNPMMQFGMEKFCQKCAEVGIDGLIIPDLPLNVYENEYKVIFEKYGLKNVFLITPQTSKERIAQIDAISDSFIYMVSSAAVTGSQTGFGNEQLDYFKRISDLNLKNPQIVGFGIKDKETFSQATKHQKGAIIGSAFIKFLKSNTIYSLKNFIGLIKK